MSPELRERLIALLEAIVHPDQEERCPVCISTHCSHDDYSGEVQIQHTPDCELAACLQELRALEPAWGCKACGAVMVQRYAAYHRCPPSNPF